MLQFDNVSTFTSKFNELELLVEAYDDAFMSQYGHLSNEEINDKEDELNYNPDQPYLDFINQLGGFNSLFVDIRNKEEVFLNQEVLDNDNDPDNHFVFDDELRVLLNTDGQAIIGTRIYQFTQFGNLSIEFTNDIDIIKSLSTDDVRVSGRIPANLDLQIEGSYYGSPGLISLIDPAGEGGTGSDSDSDSSTGSDSDCFTEFSDIIYEEPIALRRIKAKQKMIEGNLFWESQVKSKTVHFERSNGKWKRRRAIITAGIQGPRGVNGCTGNEQDLSKTKNRRQVRLKQKWGGQNPYSTKALGKLTTHSAHGQTYSYYFKE